VVDVRGLGRALRAVGALAPEAALFCLDGRLCVRGMDGHRVVLAEAVLDAPASGAGRPSVQPKLLAAFCRSLPEDATLRVDCTASELRLSAGDDEVLRVPYRAHDLVQLRASAVELDALLPKRKLDQAAAHVADGAFTLRAGAAALEFVSCGGARRTVPAVVMRRGEVQAEASGVHLRRVCRAAGSAAASARLRVHASGTLQVEFALAGGALLRYTL